MTADTLHIRCGCYLQPLFAQSLKHLQVKWRYMLVLVPWSLPTSWLINPGAEVHSCPVLQVNHESCSCTRVFYIVEIVGVSEGIWSVKTSDWQTEKDSRENMSSQPLFSSVVRQVHPLPSGQEGEESGAGGQEEQGMKSKVKTRKKWLSMCSTWTWLYTE